MGTLYVLPSYWQFPQRNAFTPHQKEKFNIEGPLLQMLRGKDPLGSFPREHFEPALSVFDIEAQHELNQLCVEKVQQFPNPLPFHLIACRLVSAAYYTRKLLVVRAGNSHCLSVELFNLVK